MHTTYKGDVLLILAHIDGPQQWFCSTAPSSIEQLFLWKWWCFETSIYSAPCCIIYLPPYPVHMSPCLVASIISKIQQAPVLSNITFSSASQCVILLFLNSKFFYLWPYPVRSAIPCCLWGASCGGGSRSKLLLGGAQHQQTCRSVHPTQ